jgi:hypothetical protein
MPWCKHNTGRYINQNDTVETSDLASGLDGTKEAWQQAYNDDYLNPPAGLNFRNVPREPEPSTTDKKPPPNLTPAKELSGSSMSAIRATTNIWISNPANST